MSKKRQKETKDKTEKGNPEEEAPKNEGNGKNELLLPQFFDEYQCTGNTEIDFPGLCALLEMEKIPVVKTKTPICLTENEEESLPKVKFQHHWMKPCLHVDLDSKDPLSATNLKVSGWKVDEQMFKVLQKILLSLSKLQSVWFWQADLTNEMVIGLVNTISLCTNLSAVTLEGNPLPEPVYHLLLSEDSALTHLSLRNNQIGDEDARLIGAALSTTRSANKNLLSLNLAFNCIGDEGAIHIAQGLRLNRALMTLSLSNNKIGDSGAAELATILSDFPLTHPEIVERRTLVFERLESSSFDSGQMAEDNLPSAPSGTSLRGDMRGRRREALRKDERSAAVKENLRSNKKAAQSRGGKNLSKEKQTSAQEDGSSNATNEADADGNALLDPRVQGRDGMLIQPANTTLTSLNLSGNRITEKSLPLFLKSLEIQSEEGGLLRLCLQRNDFPAECPIYVKIMELMTLRDPLRKNVSSLTDEEESET